MHDSKDKHLAFQGIFFQSLKDLTVSFTEGMLSFCFFSKTGNFSLVNLGTITAFCCYMAMAAVQHFMFVHWGPISSSKSFLLVKLTRIKTP